MPLLSIIIVNYNVKYFAEQCLYSVEKAIEGLSAEVLVVDNNSGDKSVEYLREKFPWVKFLENDNNEGFARANNKAVGRAAGDYILFLNPDTIITVECLAQSIKVLAANLHYAALGCRMIDGTGHYLPESKRGFPSPATSFFKLAGFAGFFPRSKTLGRYYMGWLREQIDNPVEVLSGAYLMIRASWLKDHGYFDEKFFMYGEDIDISFRVSKTGYSNYYLGSQSIIHFKGESTFRDRRYTNLFYEAMNIFVNKHYALRSRVFRAVMKAGISAGRWIASARQAGHSRKTTVPSRKQIITIVVGSAASNKQVLQIIANTSRTVHCIDTIVELDSLAARTSADEIIFCAGEISYAQIIGCIEIYGARYRCWISAAGSKSIVSSTSKDKKGEVLIFQQ